MATSDRDIVQALRAALTLEQAKSSPDEDVLRKLRSHIVRIKADPDDIDKLKRADLLVLKQTPSALVIGSFAAALASIRGYWGELLDDDPDPSAMDQKKVRNKLRGIVDDPGTPPDVLAAAQDFLRIVVQDYRNTDPVEAELTTDLADLSGGNWDSSTLPALLGQISSRLPLVEKVL